MSTATWTTREGKELKISEMETSHIQNCIKMLERLLDQNPNYPIGPEPQDLGMSEVAQDTYEMEVRHNNELEEEIITKLGQLKNELERRTPSPSEKVAE